MWNSESFFALEKWSVIIFQICSFSIAIYQEVFLMIENQFKKKLQTIFQFEFFWIKALDWFDPKKWLDAQTGKQKQKL